MKIRNAKMKDLFEIAEIEKVCFPKEEAATEEIFQKRLERCLNYFWLLEVDKKIVGFINGIVTNEDTISDMMYEDIKMHKEDGKWLAIFGVDILPEYQHQGLASKMMEFVIKEVFKQNKAGIILTCKEKLIPFYEKFGYINTGKSKSIHGNAVWYDMRLEIKRDM